MNISNSALVLAVIGRGLLNRGILYGRGFPRTEIILTSK
jgi:hypothetical protein